MPASVHPHRSQLGDLILSQLAAAMLLVHAVVENDIAAIATCLGFVHGRVRIADHIFRVYISGVTADNPDARGRTDFMIPQPVLFAHAAISRFAV